MVLVLILMVIATPAFYKMALKADFHPGKAASIPCLFGGVIFLLQYCVNSLGESLSANLPIRPTTVGVILFMANIFLLIAYFLAISRIWGRLRRIVEISEKKKSTIKTG